MGVEGAGEPTRVGNVGRCAGRRLRPHAASVEDLRNPRRQLPTDCSIR
jgi:hypothetical protein